jgi:hypothetical protein
MWSCQDHTGTEVRIVSSRTDAMPLLFQYGAYPSGNAFITFKIKASITQVICQNITVPNITTETYKKYNNI